MWKWRDAFIERTSLENSLHAIYGSDHPEAQWLSSVLTPSPLTIEEAISRLVATQSGAGYFYASRLLRCTGNWRELTNKAIALKYELAILLSNPMTDKYAAATLCIKYEWKSAYLTYARTFAEDDPWRYYWCLLCPSTRDIAIGEIYKAIIQPPNDRVCWMIGSMINTDDIRLYNYNSFIIDGSNKCRIFAMASDEAVRKSLIVWILGTRHLVVRDVRRIIAKMVWSGRITTV